MASEQHGSSGSGAAWGIAAFAGLFLLFNRPSRWAVRRAVDARRTTRYIERMQITDAGFDLDIKHTRGYLGFTINNPNVRPMNIQAIVGHVTVFQDDPRKGGFRIGDVDRFQPILIKPLSAEKVKLVVQIKAVNSLAYLAQVLTGKWRGQLVNFQGTITANGRPWPINETIKLSR